MRYKLLQDIKEAKAWTIFRKVPEFFSVIWIELVEWENLWTILNLINCMGLDNKEWFEEVKEVKSPKYKVGDYVVYDNWMAKEYIKIIKIYLFDGELCYNSFTTKFLREPTEQELETYFR